jgi:phosphoribosylformylglycinamidine synthase
VETPLRLGHTEYSDDADSFYSLFSNLSVCSQKGLAERFDSTIGAGSVTMPFGGKYQMTPNQAMIAKIPVGKGETNTASVMAWGYNPYLTEKSPYLGAMAAVIESAAKVIAAGGELSKIYLTFQEYFERTKNNPTRWGKPLAALLGAYKAQTALGIAAIGGKDSMSGSFENIDVPPTLVSFAVSTLNIKNAVTSEFKKPGSAVIYLAPERDKDGLPDFDSVKAVFAKIKELTASGRVLSSWASGFGGIAEAVMKMSMGNRIGFRFTVPAGDTNFYGRELFHSHYGAIVAEIAGEVPEDLKPYIIGETVASYNIITPNTNVDMEKAERMWAAKLEPIFPVNTRATGGETLNISYKTGLKKSSAVKIAKPRVLIPVFPGTNCEDDTARAFEKAGAEPVVFVIRNLSKDALAQSIEAFTGLIKNAQIIMLPGGFSGGDEPDGSAKFITAFFKNPGIADATTELLERRDGLMLGICNGFQALIKLGLIETGRITPQTENSPTLTFNTISRHQSLVVHTKIVSDKSPWLYETNVGDIVNVPISHGEGRFVAPSALAEKFAQNGQICAQYCDFDGNATLDIAFNPNGSMSAAEAVCSPDGRVLGKMGHSERVGNGLYKNIPGNFDSGIFKSGVKYFL